MTSHLPPRANLVVVTGKGGVGKTTIAAALGLAAAQTGRRTIVCEVGGQARLPAMFGVPAGPRGRESRLGDGLWTMSIDPVEALAEWLGRQLPARLAGILSHSGTFGAFVAAAPGAAELVSVTKAWELGASPRWDRSQKPYDCVVLDAPASGHGIGMLRAPRTYAEIARVGPVARQARQAMDGLVDPERSAYVAVAAPTELAVSETLDLEHRLAAQIGRHLHAVVCNGVLPRRFDRDEAERVGAVDGRAARAVQAATGRARAQRSQLARLRRDARAPVVTLPLRITASLSLGDVRDLAGRLSR